VPGKRAYRRRIRNVDIFLYFPPGGLCPPGPSPPICYIDWLSIDCLLWPLCLFVPGMVPRAWYVSLGCCALLDAEVFQFPWCHLTQQSSVLSDPSQNLVIRHMFSVRDAHASSVTLHFQRIDVPTELFIQCPCLRAVCNYRPNQGPNLQNFVKCTYENVTRVLQIVA